GFIPETNTSLRAAGAAPTGETGPGQRRPRLDRSSWGRASSSPLGREPGFRSREAFEYAGSPIHAPIPVRSVFIIGYPGPLARPLRRGGRRLAIASRRSRAADPVPEPREHGLGGECIEDMALLQPAAAGHRQAVIHIVEPADGVGIGID